MKKNLVISLIMLVAGISSASAQIKYSDGSVKINGAGQKLSYKMTAKGLERNIPGM